MFPEGITRGKLLEEGLRLGNTTNKVMEYITTLVTLNLITRRAEKYYVNELNYLQWAQDAGFREPVIEVQCMECGCVYSSNEPKCRMCGSLDRKEYVRAELQEEELEEPDTYTHIPTNIQHLSKEDLEFDHEISELEPPEPTHIDTNTKEIDQNQAGKAAANRVVQLLGQLGRARLGPGKNGEPDVLWFTDNGRYAVEVKSVQNQVRCGSGEKLKANTVRATKSQWISVCDYADAHDLEPIMVVELKINGSPNKPIYHIIPRDRIDQIVDRSEGPRVAFSVHDLPLLSIQPLRPGSTYTMRCVL